MLIVYGFFFQAEDGIRDDLVTGVQTCALPISAPSGGVNASGVALSRASRNCTGSLPAACASSSMNDCITKAMPLLPGARIAPVGTPVGIRVLWVAKLGTKRAGNSSGEIPAADAKRSPSPIEMK